MLSTSTKRLVSSLVCRENGPALASLALDTSTPTSSASGEDSVHVRMLMAPINPADLNQIEGTYAFIPPKPFVAGNEGVGEVVSVGSSVKSLKAGDWVIPAVAGLGTWRTELVCPEPHLMSVPKDIPLEAAATVLVNPCTAYRMLEDFVSLQPGDCLIQNGANSAVGRAVIQMAALKGVKTVNIVRDRPNFEALELELRQLGATMVVKSEQLPLAETQEHISKVIGKKPVLGLNCVGGAAATDLARSLEHGGTLVTYGAMSKKPVSIPTGLLIFQDIKIVGFWVSAWYTKQHALAQKGDQSLTIERSKMMTQIFDWIRQGKLSLPRFRMHPLESWKNAIEEAMSPYTGCKEAFKFTQ